MSSIGEPPEDPAAQRIIHQQDVRLAELKAQIERLRAAVKPLVAVEVMPGWLAYVGEDPASCTYCYAYSGSPYEYAEVQEWSHNPGCPIPIARAALEMS